MTSTVSVGAVELRVASGITPDESTGKMCLSKVACYDSGSEVWGASEFGLECVTLCARMVSIGR